MRAAVTALAVAALASPAAAEDAVEVAVVDGAEVAVDDDAEVAVADEAATTEVSGYGQLDLLAAQDSEDQLDEGTGEPRSRDRLVVPRARLAVAGATRRADYVAELDARTTGGAALGFRRLEAGLRWATPAAWLGAPLALRIGGGVFAAPFGHEVTAPDQDRLFTERALFADALFPGQLDLGVRASATLEAIAVTVAVQNGEPLGAAGFPGRDPNAAKDVLARITAGAAVGPVRISGGVSAMRGRGFHPGAPPGKDTLVWRDLNEDGIAQTGELTVIPGTAGVPSENFDRWGAGADLQLAAQLPPGELALFVEGALAANLDRAVRPADPVALGRDQRTRGAVIGLVQALGCHALVGARLDYYRPELDATELAGGQLVRARHRFVTATVAAAWRFAAIGRHPARLTLEYRHQDDPLARDAEGRPADLANDTLTARFQIEVGR